MKKCPYCAEEIQDEALVCRYCGRELAPEQVAGVDASIGKPRMEAVERTGDDEQVARQNPVWGRAIVTGLGLAVLAAIPAIAEIIQLGTIHRGNTQNIAGHFIVNWILLGLVAGIFFLLWQTSKAAAILAVTLLGSALAAAVYWPETAQLISAWSQGNQFAGSTSGIVSCDCPPFTYEMYDNLPQNRIVCISGKVATNYQGGPMVITSPPKWDSVSIRGQISKDIRATSYVALRGYIRSDGDLVVNDSGDIISCP